MLGGLAGEIEVVHRSDDPPIVQEDVEEHDGQGNVLSDHAEQNEHVGDHHGREQLEEVLDPEMDHPEAPEFGGGEVVAGAGD